MQMMFDAEAADAFDDEDSAEAAGRCVHETRLLRWARAVCSNFGVEVGGDVSASFADGRALCVLVHAYAVGRCRLTGSNPALKAPVISALESMMW